MTTVKGRVIGASDFFEFKVGHQVRAEYCTFTLKTTSNEMVQVVASTKTMLEKTFMEDPNNGRFVQVGMVKPRVGDILEVEGSMFRSDDGVHARTIKFVKRIVRETHQRWKRQA